eukprot:299671-Alexandrium_andersonii.AAC.1
MGRRFWNRRTSELGWPQRRPGSGEHRSSDGPKGGPEAAKVGALMAPNEARERRKATGVAPT